MRGMTDGDMVSSLGRELLQKILLPVSRELSFNQNISITHLVHTTWCLLNKQFPPTSFQLILMDLGGEYQNKDIVNLVQY